MICKPLNGTGQIDIWYQKIGTIIRSQSLHGESCSPSLALFLLWLKSTMHWLMKSILLLSVNKKISQSFSIVNIGAKKFCTVANFHSITNLQSQMLPTLPKNQLYSFGLSVQSIITKQMAEIEEEASLEESANDLLYKTVSTYIAFIPFEITLYRSYTCNADQEAWCSSSESDDAY